MPANLDVFITRTITDTKTGKVIKRYRKRQSKSFVVAFIQILSALMGHTFNAGSDSITVTDTSNAGQTVDADTETRKCTLASEEGAGSGLVGIVVGTGVTAPDIDDYTLETKIAQGVGAGQLQYGACGVGVPAKVGATYEMVITRAVVNGSGGTITVKEVGLYCRDQMTNWYFLLLHDAVDDAINNGQTYTVTYTIVIAV